jgi:hypothetical protein
MHSSECGGFTFVLEIWGWVLKVKGYRNLVHSSIAGFFDCWVSCFLMVNHWSYVPLSKIVTIAADFLHFRGLERRKFLSQGTRLEAGRRNPRHREYSRGVLRTLRTEPKKTKLQNCASWTPKITGQYVLWIRWGEASETSYSLSQPWAVTRRLEGGWRFLEEGWRFLEGGCKVLEESRGRSEQIEATGSESKRGLPVSPLQRWPAMPSSHSSIWSTCGVHFSCGGNNWYIEIQDLCTISVQKLYYKISPATKVV